MGGWNSGYPAQFANKFTTNEIWRSLTRGASWQKVLPNDDSLASGTSRWRRRHTFAHCVHKCNGVDYLCIVNGDMWDDISGVNGGHGIYDHVPRDVWRSKDILNWELMTNATPWSQRTLGMAASYKGLLYFMGGQTDFTQQATALNEVWVSADCGATWKRLPNGPWAARSQGGLLTFNSYLYLVGGFRYDNRSSSQVYYNDVWRFNGEIWEDVLANAPWDGKGYISCVVFDNKLWVLSGSRGHNTNEVWFSDTGDRWTRQLDVPWQPSHADGFCVTDTPGILQAAGNYSVTSNERYVWEMVVL